MNRRALIACVLTPGLLAAGVLGIGAASSYLTSPSRETGSTASGSLRLSHARSNSEVVTQLSDYARSVDKEPASARAAGELLPDVNTMIERLAARLETTPGDVKGWRMLGWSYFQTARYKEAAAAYAKAVELDPDTDDLKLAYGEAKARASDGNTSGSAPSSREGGPDGR